MKQGEYFSPKRPKGVIVSNSETKTNEWSINPPGGYHGFRLEADISNIKKPEKHQISIFTEDSLWNTYQLTQLPRQLFIPAQKITLKLQQKKSFKKAERLKINYWGEPIDSTILYCSGTHYINETSGQIEDGSGSENYTNFCSCKWIINVPQGQRVRFTFNKMDTEGNVDFVYLVDGQTAVPERIFAKFSGQNIPPVVTSRTNEVLIWFVTDGQTTGKGWQFTWESVE